MCPENLDVSGSAPFIQCNSAKFFPRFKCLKSKRVIVQINSNYVEKWL